MVSALYKLTAQERRSYNKTLHPLGVMARDVWPAEGLCSLGSERTFGRRGLLGQGLKKKKSVWQWQLEGENRSRKREAGERKREGVFQAEERTQYRSLKGDRESGALMLQVDRGQVMKMLKGHEVWTLSLDHQETSDGFLAREWLNWIYIF